MVRADLAGRIPDIEILAVDQSMRFISEPVKQMERLILNKQCRHGGHPVMRWMASNAVSLKTIARMSVSITQLGAKGTPSRLLPMP